VLHISSRLINRFGELVEEKSRNTRLGNNIKRTSLTEEILLFKYNTSTTNNEKRNFLRKEEVKKSQYVIIILYIILVNTMFHNFEENGVTDKKLLNPWNVSTKKLINACASWTRAILNSTTLRRIPIFGTVRQK
jgi:hypothetical protein